MSFLQILLEFTSQTPYDANNRESHYEATIVQIFIFTESRR